jgi:hypothetical protein
MQLRIYSRPVWVALHFFGCVLGLLVLGYAIFTWAGYGFTLGPDQRLHPGGLIQVSALATFFLLASHFPRIAHSAFI